MPRNESKNYQYFPVLLVQQRWDSISSWCSVQVWVEYCLLNINLLHLYIFTVFQFFCISDKLFLASNDFPDLLKWCDISLKWDFYLVKFKNFPYIWTKEYPISQSPRNPLFKCVFFSQNWFPGLILEKH